LSHIHIIPLGRIAYADALELQQRAVELRRQQRIGDVIFLLEHPPVITLGRNAGRENILATDAQLAARGVEIFETNRGGDVTYHGPGQLVGYPILDLRGDFPRKRGPHLGPVDYVRMLEDSLMRLCGDFGVITRCIAGRTGVWTQAAPERKIAAIGVHVSVGITSHGFAFNLATDLRDFEWIVPCGIADRGVTTLAAEIDPALHAVPTMEQTMHSFARHFGRVFQRDVLWAASLQALE
jgi:lipoyl(octanoyl) transferase